MAAQKESYCTIFLTQNQVAIVDREDYEGLNKFKWQAQWEPTSHCFYAVRNKVVEGKQILIRMHREILGLKYKDGKFCDHKNRNGLDNRRLNLRVATRNQNMHNSSRVIPGCSGMRGVYFQPITRKWRATIRVSGRQVHLGYFETKSDARVAYCEAAIKYRGEFARLE